MHLSFLRSICFKDTIETRVGAIEQFQKGLQLFGLHEQLKLFPHLFEPVFTPSTNFEVNLDGFLSAVEVNYSADGSNKKDVEINTFKSFTDALEMAAYDSKLCI